MTFERLGTTPNLFAGLMSGYAHLRALAPPSSPANKRSTKGKMSEHTFGTQRKPLKKYIVNVVRKFGTPFLVKQMSPKDSRTEVGIQNLAFVIKPEKKGRDGIGEGTYLKDNIEGIREQEGKDGTTRQVSHSL